MRLHEWLPHWVERDPATAFAMVGERVVTRGEALRIAEGLAAALAHSGVGLGDRVVVVARNCIELPLLAVAASRLGAVLAPLNPRLAPPEWQFLIDDAEARVVLAEAELAGALGQALEGCPRVHTRVAIGGDAVGVADDDAARVAGGEPAAERAAASGAPIADGGSAAARAALVAAAGARGTAAWQALDAWVAAVPGPAPSPEVAMEDDALQLATSGTTGRPKGVVLSQRALQAALAHWQRLYPVGDGDLELLTMPMHHSGGMFFALHAMLIGACVRILRDFDPHEVLERLAVEPIVRVSLVPTMIDRCLEVAVRGRMPGPKALRILTYGGSPISVASLEAALGFFDCDLSQAYGMTELPSLTYLRADDHRRALDGEPGLLSSVGTPAPDCEVKIVDPEGHTLTPGQVGEICGRGPQQMSRYWKRPTESAETLRDGWVHTGDAGFLDAKGYLQIVDRIKDVIVTGGENVASREVEEALLAHPAVREVAVIGTPSERWGEQITAVVVLEPGARAEPAELEAFCRERIAAWKRPRRFETVEELPRNASGKVLKRALRERFGAARATGSIGQLD